MPLPNARGKKEGTSRTRRYGYRLEMQSAKVYSLTELKYYFCTQGSKYVFSPRFFSVVYILAHNMNLVVYILVHNMNLVGKTCITEIVVVYILVHSMNLVGKNCITEIVLINLY